MGIHRDLPSLIRESLPEYLEVAEYCVTTEKPAPPGRRAGCYGYPAAVMLFSIVDTIGSFYKGRSDLKIEISGKPMRITRDGDQHFYVLNSEYYGQSLDQRTIEKLYKNFRSLLVHNASLAPSHFLLNERKLPALFPTLDGKPSVNLFAFLKKSQEAANLFLDRLDKIVPGSHQAANINRKR